MSGGYIVANGAAIRKWSLTPHKARTPRKYDRNLGLALDGWQEQGYLVDRPLDFSYNYCVASANGRFRHSALPAAACIMAHRNRETGLQPVIR